jgi:hypothetical protein
VAEHRPRARAAPILPASVGSELLAGYLARHRTTGGPIYGALLLLVVGGAGALPVVEIDVSVQAPGIVRPAADKHELRAPRAGAVAAVRAHDNERVERGAEVVALRDPALDARTVAVAARLAEGRAEAHDLRALADGGGRGLALRTPRYREERLGWRRRRPSSRSVGTPRPSVPRAARRSSRVGSPRPRRSRTTGARSPAWTPSSTHCAVGRRPGGTSVWPPPARPSARSCSTPPPSRPRARRSWCALP